MPKASHEKSVMETAVQLLKRHNPGMSVDEFLCHPNAALSLCREVRLTLGKRIEDPDILRSLLNARKRSQL